MITRNKFYLFLSGILLFGILLGVMVASPVLASNSAYPNPTRTRTPTRVGPVLTATRTSTATAGPALTATRTQASGAVCSPITGTISAPFVHDGAGIFCWQSNNLGSFMFAFSLNKLTINGVDFTNMWIPAAAYPPQINGFWYVYVNSSFAHGHVEFQP